MENLNKFCKDNWYNLLDEFTFNSYRTWDRSEIRDYDSVSVTEVLWLIEDPTINMVKSLHWDKLKQACDYGTFVHQSLEDYHRYWDLEDTPINIQFKKALIENDINILEAEQTFSKDLSVGIPLTATIDAISSIDCSNVLIDYKTSKKNRNFISIKYNIQIAFYSILSWIDRWAILYLNQKWYKFIEVEDLEYYKKVATELLEYAESLFYRWWATNLATNLY